MVRVENVATEAYAGKYAKHYGTVEERLRAGRNIADPRAGGLLTRFRRLPFPSRRADQGSPERRSPVFRKPKA